jgi:hypothetical protein
MISSTKSSFLICNEYVYFDESFKEFLSFSNICLKILNKSSVCWESQALKFYV